MQYCRLLEINISWVLQIGVLFVISIIFLINYFWD
jgi:hypothetical protein